MAVETSSLVNGAWTTRTLDVNAVLRHYDQQDKESNANAVEVEKAPLLGLLTQTVIRSPLAHWILPVKLRSPDTNDVAFIGDEFVQIKELRPDGHLWDVIRKENFGARIRNACVVGSTEAYKREQQRPMESTQIKDEEDDVDMDVDATPNLKLPGSANLLPPQVILLQLDSGDSVFLMLRPSARGAWRFVSSRHRVSKSMLRMQPGMHLTVDPSSRYMAIGCSEGLFAIYSLHPREELQKQYTLGPSLRHIDSERHIYLQGVIHKMEFLHPTAEDEEHVILLVLMIRKGQTRMLLYEWETGGNLRDVRANSRRGHLLEEARQMPLLIIPLTIKSSFILVSARSMSVCQDILQGSPRFIDFNDRVDPPTPLFHGSGFPLWTSWTRPVRLPDYKVTHDDIYIVREDGLIKFIETDCQDEEFVKAEMTIGNFACSCGPALASLDYHTYNDHTRTGDLLITAGDSCPGGAYLIKAREAPKFTESIQNWSPAQDFVTSSMIQEDNEHRETSIQDGSHREFVPRPDRIFSCVGKGSSGAITEFRHGIEASVGLEMAYDTQIMQIWVFSANLDSLNDDGGSLFLLSLADRSSVLHLSSDATEIVELDQHSTEFDLQYRTIAASAQGNCKIQVTEQSIILINGLRAQTHYASELLNVHKNQTFIGSGEKLDLAVIYENFILFTTRFEQISYLQVLKSTATDIVNSRCSHLTAGIEGVQTLARCSQNVSCLAICLIAQTLYGVVAEWNGDSVRLTFQPLDGAEPYILNVEATSDDDHLRIEAFVSINVTYSPPGYLILICGTRNGILVTLEVDQTTIQILRSWRVRIGATPAIVRGDEYPGPRDVVFVSCDSKMYALMTPVENSRSTNRIPSRTRKIHQIFLTDALNPNLQQPSINSIARLRPNLSGGTDGGLVLVAGSQILLAGLSTQPKAVPRHIPIGGTPSRLLYSNNLGCLIVAASVNGRCTLLFIDPDTGEDISRPMDKKDGKEVDFVSGLGNFNERVFRLLEWSYIKGDKEWRFIIVCTSTGRLLIISTDKSKAPQARPRAQVFEPLEGDPPKSGLGYWTLHRFKCAKPVYSVAGFEDGLFYCAGDMLYCETLDILEKRFKRVAEYELPSPALHLVYKHRRIYALTSAHSLEVLETTLDVGGTFKIIRTHGDQVSRNTLHHKIISQVSESPIDLISDKSCSVVGLWATHNTRADTLETVFEGQLPYSILRFRTGKCRPIWDQSWYSSYGDGTVSCNILPNSATYPEILGLSIDGSLCNLTVLDFAAWQFLRFLVNLAKQSPTVCEFTYVQGVLPLEPVTEPKTMMHIDGDILRRCLEDGHLEELLCIGQETEVAGRIHEKFVQVLQELHRGRLENNATLGVYVEQAYRDLEFFLRTVL